MIETILTRIPDTIGIFGVILLLIAYYFLNTSRMSALSLTYQLLNLIGSTMILFSLLFAWNLSAFVIESSWIFISGIGIYRIYLFRKQHRKY